MRPQNIIHDTSQPNKTNTADCAAIATAAQTVFPHCDSKLSTNAQGHILGTATQDSAESGPQDVTHSTSQPNKTDKAYRSASAAKDKASVLHQRWQLLANQHAHITSLPTAN